MNAKTKATYENGTSYLHISNAQRDDIGHFRCIADNRVANPISRDVLLIVKCKLVEDDKMMLMGGDVKWGL
jgi:nephron